MGWSTLTRRILVLVAVVAVCWSTTVDVAKVTAQDRPAQPVVLREMSRIGGPISTAAVAGRHAYAAVGPRFVVLEAEPSGQLREVGSVAHRWQGLTSASLATDSRVFVTTSADLLTFDVSDPTAPRRTGRARLGGSGLYVLEQRIGKHIFVATSPASNDHAEAEVIVVDVTTSAALTVGRAELADVPNHDASNKFWHVVDAGVPVLVGGDGRLVALESVARGVRARPLAPLPLTGELVNIATHGHLVFAAIRLPDESVVIEILDLSTPEAPALLWRSEGLEARRIQLAADADHLHFSTSTERTWSPSVAEDLIVLSVADPTRPTEVGRVAIETPQRILAGDDLAITVPISGSGGWLPETDLTAAALAAVDLGGGTPRLAGSFHSRPHDPTKLIPVSDHVVVENVHMDVFDLSQPTKPRHAGTWPAWPDMPHGGIAGMGPYHVAINCGSDPVGVSNLDLSDPLHPIIIGHAPVSGGLCDPGFAPVVPSVAVGDRFVAVIGGAVRRPVLVSTDDPTDLRVAATLDIELPLMAALDSLLVGYHYQTEEIVVLSLVDPSDPVELARMSMSHHGPPAGPFSPTGIVAIGSNVLMRDGSDTIVVDVSSPSRPADLGALDAFPWPVAVADDGVLYGAMVPPVDSGTYRDSATLVAMDVSDILRPRTLGSLTYEAGEAGYVGVRDLAVAGNSIYLIDWFQGLKTFKTLRHSVFLPLTPK